MASLLLKNIYKVYPSGVTAVSDFNLDIQDKEFIVFVGPSGCGKSTTLRMIAGLEEISKGELYIDGRLVNDVVPKDRDIAMVFQNYALYPHMTVYDNMAFGLKLRKMPKAQIDARVKEAARILGIEMYLSRKPKALSGGQRQRVALGRAIVREPKVFLLDEPLSNLDAKLRAQMRTEITKLHNRLATTFIYVTHDQVEAMTMGTRIVVMKDGFMQQVDTPENLYDYPINQFVAGFLGTPQMNFFNAKLVTVDGEVAAAFGKDKVILPKFITSKIKCIEDYLDTDREIVFGVRPEDIHDEAAFIAASPKSVVKCRVDVLEKLGAETLLYCDLNYNPDEVNEGDSENLSKIKSLTEDITNMIARVDSRTTTQRGQVIEVAFDVNHIHMFDKDTEMSILARSAEEAAETSAAFREARENAPIGGTQAPAVVAPEKKLAKVLNVFKKKKAAEEAPAAEEVAPAEEAPVAEEVAPATEAPVEEKPAKKVIRKPSSKKKN